MIEKKPQSLSFRPYARLLTMLGDELIRDEKIALIELIKNSYDADADWVQVRFGHFASPAEDGILVPITDEIPFIEIEDNGDGIAGTTIQNTWMSPATPVKKSLKIDNQATTPRKHRIIQGEKGIGRFSLLKLGSTIEILSKNIDASEKEVRFVIDLSKYDQDFNNIDKAGSKTPLFLDQLQFELDTPTKKYFKKERIKISGRWLERGIHGTKIRITNLKSKWSISKIKDILEDVAKLTNPIGTPTKGKTDIDFKVEALLNGSPILVDSSRDKIDALMEKAILTVEGEFSTEGLTFRQNGHQKEWSIKTLYDLTDYRKRFLLSQLPISPKKQEKLDDTLFRKPECGPFKFSFYIFDFSKDAIPKKTLDKLEREIIKNHRIYLYRDGVRVYPYGDKNDDWLGIDILRGTGRAGDYLSNDQTIGSITISQKSNPLLKDKTSREGLLEIGNAFEDFVVVIRAILSKLRLELKVIKNSIQGSKPVEVLLNNQIDKHLQELALYLEKNNDLIGRKQLSTIREKYSIERKHLLERIDITEDLAAVGLSVEITAHDTIATISALNITFDNLLLLTAKKDADIEFINQQLIEIKTRLVLIEDVLNGIKPIFRSVKRKRSEMKLSEILKQVYGFYSSLLARRDIHYEIRRIGPDLEISCIEGLLMQVFINLFDNAVYWLSACSTGEKHILVQIDGNQSSVIFSDNGPGVDPNYLPLIFQPFFSGKGEAGRGLGLYIARELLARFDYQIECIDNGSEQILPGANFIITF